MHILLCLTAFMGFLGIKLRSSCLWDVLVPFQFLGEGGDLRPSTTQKTKGYTSLSKLQFIIERSQDKKASLLAIPQSTASHQRPHWRPQNYTKVHGRCCWLASWPFYSQSASSYSPKSICPRNHVIQSELGPPTSINIQDKPFPANTQPKPI